MREVEGILEVRDAAYRYEGEARPVWEGLSASFLEGAVNAVCGPSGCGKSSLLYLLDGLIPHMYEGELSGRVFLSGRDVTQLEPRLRCEDIGFVMQSPESQFVAFTVEEELAFGMENIGLAREEMAARIAEALEFVGMTGFEQASLDDLSGGQKQKVAIASILVMRPRILLLDEPTANLDPASRRQVFDLIVRTAAEQGTTVVLVEHNIAEISDKVGRFVVMDREGRVVFQGPRDGLPAQTLNPWAGVPVVPLARRDRSTDEEVLSIEGLRFAYPVPGRARKGAEAPKPVLDGVDLRLRRQEFVAVVGENGAGKTTLTRLVFRILKPDAGSIRVLGRPVEAYRRNELYNLVGLVFQNPESQFVKNTVEEEMLFSLKRTRLGDEEKAARVEGMLRRFHLQDCRQKSPFVLSQGQKRRLSVATMLLTDQQLLFLDEPTYGQDFENRQELMRDMSSLVEEGITIVMITHDLELVRRYATRVVELVGGRVGHDEDVEAYFAARDARDARDVQEAGR